VYQEKKYFEIKLLKKNSHNSVVLISQKKLGKKLHKETKALKILRRGQINKKNTEKKKKFLFNLWQKRV